MCYITHIDFNSTTSKFSCGIDANSLGFKGEIEMAIKDLKSNFKIIKLSKNIHPKRKQFLLEKTLCEIELLYFEDATVDEDDKQRAGKLYKDIQTYLHLF